MPRRVRFNLRREGLTEIKALPGVQAELHKEAVQLNALARSVFMARVKHLQPVTPPPYAGQFKIRRVRHEDGSLAYEAYNDDPAAFWVEFGAYLRQPNQYNHPRILGYRPFGVAMDIASSGRAIGTNDE